MFKSVPQKGAIVRDWTKATIVLDIENSIGEAFHFEILPNETNNLPTRASDGPGKKNAEHATLVNMIFPIL